MRGTAQSAHRLSFELFNGPIPEDMTVDHTCFNPPCANPAHLRLLTRSENSRATRTPKLKYGRCGRGHDISIHGYYRKDRPGQINCRECRREARARVGVSASGH